MKILYTINELKTYKKSIKTQTLGFVPTMGALHEGHLSLIKKSKSENEKTIVSIYVNPTQFLENEDFSKYPKKIEADLKLCELLGVDGVFLPDTKEMYFENDTKILPPLNKSYILEGFNRPKHFDGVLSVVLKLFNLVKPDNAYFGKKDAQQLYLIKNMVKNLFLDIKINPCEIIRDKDGLALSSRNVYLSSDERQNALKLSSSLFFAAKEIMRENFDANNIKEKMQEILNPLQIGYVEIVNLEFEKLEKIELKNTIILVAAYVGSTRLIDNIWI